MEIMKARGLFLCFLLGIVSSAVAVDFETEVFPILKNHCGDCHMDGESKGNIVLDRDAISGEIGSDGSIIPGDVKGSDLHWTMTLPPDDELAMPPKGPRVPASEIDLIAKWIAAGASLESTAVTGMGGPMAGGDAMSGQPETAEKKPYKGTFKNIRGMQVPATLTAVEGDRAILVLPDGKSYRYPIELFAEESREIVRKFQEGTLEAPQ